MTNKCLNCNKNTNNPKYCSKSCSAVSNGKLFPKRKRSKKCGLCDTLVPSGRTYCSVHRDSYRFIPKELRSLNLSKEELLKVANRTKSWNLRTLTIADYVNRDCIKKLHGSSKFAHIRGLCRSWNKELTTLPCFNCKYSKHVELCHIKPLSSYPDTALIGEVNARSNVVQLCPNCHWEFDNGLLVLDFPDQPKSH